MALLSQTAKTWTVRAAFAVLLLAWGGYLEGTLGFNAAVAGSLPAAVWLLKKLVSALKGKAALLLLPLALLAACTVTYQKAEFSGDVTVNDAEGTPAEAGALVAQDSFRGDGSSAGSRDPDVLSDISGGLTFDFSDLFGFGALIGDGGDGPEE